MARPAARSRRRRERLIRTVSYLFQFAYALSRMRRHFLLAASGIVFIAAAAAFAGQPPSPPASAGQGQPPAQPQFDPAAVERGQRLHVAQCGFCHGPTARGGSTGPDLTRSVLVLDDENRSEERRVGNECRSS